MTNIVVLLIFCLILLIYLHIHYQINSSSDLEVFELDNLTKDKLEKVCELRQPYVFTLDTNQIIGITQNEIINDYSNYLLKVRNINDIINNNISLPLSVVDTKKLLTEDTFSSYYTENNSEFLIETGVIKHLRSNDNILRPYMLSNSYYDILYGSDNSYTPLRYELNYRNYIHVTSGTVTIRLIPPRYKVHLYIKKDYELFEFYSLINPWKPQDKYRDSFNKCKYLDVTLEKSQFLYIPAYWLYSIRFMNESTINTFKYRTYMNNIAILPHIILSYLQLQNIKTVIAKKYNTKENISSTNEINVEINTHDTSNKCEDTGSVTNKSPIQDID